MKHRNTVGSLLSSSWACAFVFMLSQVAAAQVPGRAVEREGGWLTWVVAGGVVLVACLTGFLNAKRSHLH